MRRILITGAKGQLGVALKDILSLRPDIEALYTDADTLDITDAGQVERAVMSFRPDSCRRGGSFRRAAYTYQHGLCVFRLRYPSISRD